jgi:hypothetical protein
VVFELFDENKRWFEYNKEVSMEAIDEQYRLLHSMKQRDLSDMERRDIQINLKKLKNWIDDQTRVAKERQAQALAEGIHCLKFNQKGKISIDLLLEEVQ